MSFQVPNFQLYAFQAPVVTSPVGPTITDEYTFNPDLADAFEEAFERAGVAPKAIGQDHITSALRSCRYMLNSEWSTFGFRQWMIEQYAYTTTTGQAYFDLPEGAVDVFNMILRRQNADTQMYAISRSDYDAIATKGVAGRPNQVFIQKSYNRLRAWLWPIPENDTDMVVVDYLRQISDVGEMSNTLQMPPQAQECFISGLAMYLARKFNYERFHDLRIEYGGPAYPEKLGGKIFQMRAATAENADVQFTYKRRR